MSDIDSPFVDMFGRGESEGIATLNTQNLVDMTSSHSETGKCTIENHPRKFDISSI
jgi:hypothetical protein